MEPKKRIETVEAILETFEFLTGAKLRVCVNLKTEDLTIEIAKASQNQIIRLRKQLQDLDLSHIELKALPGAISNKKRFRPKK